MRSSLQLARGLSRRIGSVRVAEYLGSTQRPAFGLMPLEESGYFEFRKGSFRKLTLGSPNSRKMISAFSLRKMRALLLRFVAAAVAVASCAAQLDVEPPQCNQA